MTKNKVTNSHAADYDKLTRVVKFDAHTIDYRRGYKKLYCYQDNDFTLYIPARDYDDAKHKLNILLTNTSDK